MLQTRVETPKPRSMTFLRVSRYFTTFKWFFGRTLELATPRFIAVLVSSAAARIGNLIGFIVAIKSAALLLSQDHVPQLIADVGFGQSQSPMFTVLLLVMAPLIFIASAFAQNIYTQSSGQVRATVGHALATRAVQRQLTAIVASGKNHPTQRIETAKTICADFGQLYRRVQRAEGSLISMAVSSNILFLSVLIGLYIDTYLMGVTMGVAAVLMLCYLWFRHGHSIEHAAQYEELAAKERAGRVELVRSMRDWLGNPKDETQIATACADYERLATDQRKLSEHFRTQSLFMLNFGQALLMLTFLLVLKDEGMIDASRFAELAALILILRFALSAMQLLVTSAVTFSRDYPMLNALRTGESMAGIEPPPVMPEYEEEE